MNSEFSVDLVSEQPDQDYQTFSTARTQWADPVLVPNNHKRLGRYAVEISSVIEKLLLLRIEVVCTPWSVLYPHCVVNRFKYSLTMRFRVVNVVQAASQTRIGIKLLAIEGHHGKMDQPEL